jgi:hypothetical protein
MLLANKVGQLTLSNVQALLSFWVHSVCLVPVSIIEFMQKFDLENSWQKNALSL